jgi:hypothetical protein
MALFDDASLVVTPNGYKAGTLYSIKPTSGAGDMTVVRATTATRVNSAGLIESVAINVPRLDYTDSTCPSLLVEPQRTNIALYSEQFDNAAYVKSGNGVGVAPVVTANDEISPDGYQNADKIDLSLSGGTSSSDWSWIYRNYSATISQPQAISLYLKAATALDVGKIIRVGFVAYVNHTLTADWTRVQLTQTPASTANFSLGFRLRGNEATANTASFYAWGMQLEQNSSYATSYIPTTSAAVTRNADVISKTGISSLIGQTEGTMYAEVDLSIQSEAGLFRRILMISNGTETDSTYLRVTSGNIVQFVSFDGTVQTLINSISSISGNVKIAATYKTNEFKLYINGVLQGTDLLGSIPATRSILRVGNSDALISAHNLNDRIELATLFQTALTDAQCISLTT